MPSVMEEQPPRSNATVEKLAGDAARRVKKLARLTQIVFVGFGILGAALGVIAEFSGPNPDWETAEVAALSVGLLVGVLPAWLLGKMILGDADVASDLVRFGAAHQGKLVKDFRNPWRMRVLKVSWLEDGKDSMARINLVENIETPDPDQIIVLVRPNAKRVGVILGQQGMFVGVRGW